MLLYHRVLIQISSGYPPDKRQIVYALRTRAPVLARRLLPRLACVRPAASVHPEPGSNSSSLKSFISLTDLFFCSRRIPYASTNWLQVSLDSLNLLCCTTLCQCTCCFLFGANCPFVWMGELPFLCEWANCHSPLQMPYHLICGCKGTAFFQTSKFFESFF